MKISKKEIYISSLVFLVWIFTQYIYAGFLGSLGDQDVYLSGAAPSNDGINAFSNTLITYRFYSIMSLVLPGRLSILVPMMFSAIFLFRTFKNIYFYLSRREKIILLLSLVTPHFWIWQATASKEALAVPLSLVIVYYFAKASIFKLKLEEKIFSILCFVGVFLIKVQLIPAYLILLFSLNLNIFLVYIKELRKLLNASIGVYFLAALSALSTIVVFLLNYFRDNISLFIAQIMLIGKFLKQAQKQ